MKYLITESKLDKILSTLIDDRYKGIKFEEGTFGIIGVLPHNFHMNDLHYSDWSLVYERDDEPGSKKMILWMYENDYDYFLSMIPLSSDEIKEAVKHWFEQKTKLKVDLVFIQ
jgi:hypothetical protein